MTVPNGTDPQPKKFYKVIILNPSVACAKKSFTIVSYDLNDSVQWYKTFYRHKLQNFVMS